MADYTTTPYNLEWGSSIFAKVYATNVKGDSVESIEGNGAIIIRVPDVPVNLANVPSITSGSTVGLTWEDGANNGGSEVIDYMIAIAYDDVAYSTLDSGVAQKSFSVIDLTAGTIYRFKVSSRNGFGYSDYGEEVSILAA
jgi:hypothetical protein